MLKKTCGTEFYKPTLEIARVNDTDIQDLPRLASENNDEMRARLAQNTANGMERKNRLANAIRFWVFELQTTKAATKKG
jgi:hypothetical protein